MEDAEQRKIEIYMPYYYRLGSIFSKDFFQYSIEELEIRNEFSIKLEESPSLYGAQIILKCTVDPQQCCFRLEFIEQKGQNQIKGYRLVKITGSHTCRKFTSRQEKMIVKQRKEEIRLLRGDIFNVMKESSILFGYQSSKVIMEKLAIKLDQYPNFLYRGLNKDMQKCIKKRFQNEVNRLRRFFNLKEQRNSDENNKECSREEIVDSESEFQVSPRGKSAYSNIKQ